MKILHAVLTIACLLLPLQAVAQTRTTWSSGAWSAFEGRTAGGSPVCGVIATGPQRAFTVKYFAGADHLTIQIMKESWAIPKGTRVRLELQFVGETPWTVTGMGDGKFVEMAVRGEAMPLFMREFRGASGGVVRFLGGNEAPWTLNLAGSNAASAMMMRCVGGLLGAQQGPTQPFGRPPAAPSQPFSPSPGQGEGAPGRVAPPVEGSRST